MGFMVANLQNDSVLVLDPCNAPYCVSTVSMLNRLYAWSEVLGWRSFLAEPVRSAYFSELATV